MREEEEELVRENRRLQAEVHRLELELARAEGKLEGFREGRAEALADPQPQPPFPSSSSLAWPLEERRRRLSNVE